MSAERAPETAGGFTLLEVVVALAIAALALVVLFHSGSEGLVSVDTAARAQEAVERAQSHLAAVGRSAALGQGESSGDDGGGYRWHLRITPVASWPMQTPNGAAPAATTLFDVEVAVSWPGRDHIRSVTLRSRRIAAASAGE
jgi:general secretion pathway protein I